MVHKPLRGARQPLAKERPALAGELLESAEGSEDARWAEAWAAELDRRVKGLDSGAAQPIRWEQVKAEAERHLRSE